LKLLQLAGEAKHRFSGRERAYRLGYRTAQQQLALEQGAVNGAPSKDD
jgi:hypothetical protein